MRPHRLIGAESSTRLGDGPNRPGEPPVVLVTGGARGIGRAITESFDALGAIVICTRRSATTPPSADSATGGSWHDRILDITDQASIEEVTAFIRTRWGRLDVLVNNAGVATPTRVIHSDLGGVTVDDWRNILETNVIGTWSMIAAAVPLLRSAVAPLIINISSLAGSAISGSSVPYAVSKAGVDHLTRLLAAALAPHIRVNALAPGLTETAWTSGWGEFPTTYAQRNPLHRNAAPSDIADACIGLFRSEFVTGVVLPVDGGRHLGAL